MACDALGDVLQFFHAQQEKIENRLHSPCPPSHGGRPSEQNAIPCQASPVPCGEQQNSGLIDDDTSIREGHLLANLIVSPTRIVETSVPDNLRWKASQMGLN